MAEKERPMRRSECEVTDQGTIEHILQRATVCHVAMVDGGEPYVIPMNCGWDSGHLLLHSAAQGRKIDILRANPHVCVEIEEDVQRITGRTGEDCTENYVTIIGSGTASFVVEPVAKSRDLNIIARHCHAGFPEETFTQETLERVAVIAVSFDWLTCKAKGMTPRP
ncbi:MAG: pyridoxamine 5'-phosphate oxidase family protein [Candidatus Cryosericum sp.]|nr:pyridoxamine 5'-phosphate oxidase family protein [bacterium]